MNKRQRKKRNRFEMNRLRVSAYVNAMVKNNIPGSIWLFRAKRILKGKGCQF